MAQIKISELNELETIQDNDLFVVVDESEGETKKAKSKNVRAKNKPLIAVADEEPTEFNEGDEYYNTETRLIYKAINSTTWSVEGKVPEEGIMYVVFPEKSTFAWDGSDLISVGGGSGSQVIVPGEEITEDTKLEIEDEDFGGLDGSGAYITNTYSESTTVGYSADYMNKALIETYSIDEVKTNKVWINGKPIYRKVIHLTNVIRGYKNYAHNINNLGNVIEIGGYVSISDGYNPVSRVVADNITGAGFGVINIDTQDLHTLAGSSFPTTNDVYIILEYTKTTD